MRYGSRPIRLQAEPAVDSKAQSDTKGVMDRVTSTRLPGSLPTGVILMSAFLPLWTGPPRLLHRIVTYGCVTSRASPGSCMLRIQITRCQPTRLTRQSGINLHLHTSGNGTTRRSSLTGFASRIRFGRKSTEHQRRRLAVTDDHVFLSAGNRRIACSPCIGRHL